MFLYGASGHARVKIDTLMVFLYLVLASFVFLFVFSTSTSPFYPTPFMDDSGIYQLIGKGWTEGLIPYLDLWDNKGPLLYFINAMGFLLYGGKHGVFILQVINLSLALHVIYKTIRIHYGYLASILGSTAALLWLSNMSVNNNPAEWLLIPQCFSFYLLYKWLKNYPQEDLPWTSSAIFGITIGCGLLLRFSDCLPIMGSLLAVATFLIYDGKWKEVVKHSIICITGLGIFILPFQIYFYVKGGLSEMWYASFLHNIEFVEHSRFQSYYSTYAVGSFVFSYAVYFIAIIIVVLTIAFHRTSRRLAIVLLVASVVTLVFISQTFARGTYSVSSISIFCLVVFLLDELIRGQSRLSSMWYWGVMFTMVVIIFCLQTWQELDRGCKSNDLALYKQVEKCIPASEHDSFVGFDLIPDIYVYTSLKPAHRFFIVYSGCMREGDSLIEKIRTEYQKRKPKWILVRYYGYKACIQDILDQNYNIYKTFIQGYTLYQIKQ